MNNTLFSTANFNEPAEFDDPKAVSDIETATSTVIKAAESNNHANALVNAADAGPFDKLARKYNITPRVIEEIAAAIVSGFGAANAEFRHDLAAASFSPAARPKLDESKVTSIVQSTTFHGPTEWKVSYSKGKPNFEQGRALLQEWLDHCETARADGAVKSARVSSFAVCRELQPVELKYDPAEGMFWITVRTSPIAILAHRLKNVFAVLLGKHRSSSD